MKNRYIYFFAAIAAAAALAVSCTNPVNPPPTDGDTGQVVLKVSTGEAGSARTILPAEPPSFSRYELAFAKEGADTVQVTDTSSIAGNGVTQELAAGDWTAAVNAYRMFTPTGGTATEYLAAQGSAPVTVSAGQLTPVTVFIAPVPIAGSAVKGIFTYTVSFPQGASGTLSIGSQSRDLTSGQTVSLELDPGYYDLVISLTNGDGKSAGAAQKAHIYSGLESKAVYTFIAEDFDITGIPLDALNGTPLPYNTWTDGNITTEEQVDWYKITAASAGTYAIQWNDAENNESDKTALILISAYQSDGTSIFNSYSSYWDSPRALYLSAGEIVYVRVAPHGDWALGTYAIQYYDIMNSRPQIAPRIEVQGTPTPACVVIWNSVIGATGYKVYRSSSADGPYDSLGTVNDQWPISYTDTNVSAAAAYYYKVSATNAKGEGPQSSEVSGTPLTAVADTSLTLNTWTDGNITTVEQVDWYKITAESAGTYAIDWDDAENSEGDKTALILVSAYQSDGTMIFIGRSRYWDSPQSIDLNAGETVHVRVASQGDGALGTYAIQYYDPATLPPQRASRYVDVRRNPMPLYEVTWGPVIGATGYKVYRSTSADGSYTPVKTINSDSAAYIDTNVSAGTMYYYKVSATNAHGEGELSGESAIMPSAAGTNASLTLNTWANGNITTEGQEVGAGGQVDWYKITAASTGTYTIQWNDAENSDKTLYTLVSAYRSDGTMIFIIWGSLYSPQFVDLSAGETIYVRVTSQSDGSLGTYAIRYYDPANTAQVTVNFIGPQDETINLDGDGAFLSQSDNTPISVSVNDSFTAYRWFLDGVLMEGETSNSISANTGDFAIKRHELTVFVTTSGGVEYAKSMHFTITE